MSKNDNIKTTRKDGKCKRNRHLIRFLVSCCLFLFVLCGCMLAALVLIGKHYVENKKLPQEKYPDNVIQSESFISRLSNDTLPHHYDLQLYPNLSSGTFTGKVNITLELLRPRDFIMLHSNNLTIHHAEIIYANNTEDDANVIKVEPAKIEALLIHFNKFVRPGFYYLYVEFSGSLLNHIWGFYRSQYFDEIDNVTRTIATSKFEPTYARQAFPCFDEPNMKAKFTVHLLKPSDEKYVALSNMPQIGEEETKDGTLVHFQESVKMSTYLTCFIVSDFTYTENFILPETYNIPFRVYATPAQLNKTTFATETGVKIIEYYIKYFGIPYPLPKLDLVGIPDFVSGAMEHWGLVTFRETALLYDKAISSTANKQRVASVIAHELAHSWFGNLVTMNWWDELWLNEGFASYIQYKGVNAVYPEWQMVDQFLIEDLHSVLAFDARLSSHAIVQKVETPDQITAIFDQISYNKGAAILRMLEDAVSEETFQKGVTNYLNANLYGNAVTYDLLNELQKIVGDKLNVVEFVNTWTNQTGYPIVDVKIDGDDYILTQKRFLTNPNSGQDEEPSTYGYKWTIPITYITNDNPTPQYVWFHHDMPKTVIKMPESAKWLKFNYKQIGYYRVNYQNWDEVLDHVHEMTVMDRTHLLEETFSIAAAGQLSYEVPLKLSKYMKAEENYIPWTVTYDSFSTLKMYLTNSVVLPQFKDIVIDMIDPIYQRLTWNESDSDGHLDKLARVTVLGFACKFDHPLCIDEAKEQFAEWMNGDKVLSQDLKGLVYEFGMKEGTIDEWEQLWDIFVHENDASEKLRLLKGLASINNPSQLTRLLELAKTDEYIRKQDYFSCLSYISANPVGTLLVWDYVRENWPYLVKRFTLNDRYLGSLIPTIVKTFSTVTKREELIAFFKKYPEAGAGEAARKRALEIVDNNIKWLSANKRTVENWINSQNL